MAYIRHRGKTYSVVYKILDENGEEHTTSETFATQKEADKRKKEIEYKQSIGKFEVPQCTTVKELIEEYVQIYGHDNLNPQMKEQDEGSSTITVPDGVNAELLMKVLGNPEMAALLTSLAKTMKV